MRSIEADFIRMKAEREYADWREGEITRVSLVAAILAAGRVSPTGETIMDEEALVRDAKALVDAVRAQVPAP